MQIKVLKMQFLPNCALLLWNVYECPDISDNITKLTLLQQVMNRLVWRIKTNNAAGGFNKSMHRLIQFNHESIKNNIYTTQVSSTINTKLVYYREA